MGQGLGVQCACSEREVSEGTEALCDDNGMLKVQDVKARTVAKRATSLPDPEELWWSLEQCSVWWAEHSRSDSWQTMLKSQPQIIRWGLELRPDVAEPSLAFGKCYRLEVLLGSLHDGRSTFSTQRERQPEVREPPQLSFASDGNFEIRLYPLFVNQALRIALAALTHNELGRHLMSSGRRFEFFLTGNCTRGGIGLDALRLHVRWLEDDCVWKGEALPFRQSRSNEGLRSVASYGHSINAIHALEVEEAAA
mmetsp:Transcript_91422/g.212632  ORF Transcript_91422/g.212632 Transcript_91422/m.212632 type:complete len:252 (-) Transcript_91422:68-823(-)